MTKRAVVGRAEPTIATPPLRRLTRRTSYGFDVIDFARDTLGAPLDPWEERAVIRIGELLRNGRPRFRYVLLIVARQNGKTHLLKVLALYWLFHEEHRLVVGMSTNLDYAREAWDGAIEIAETVDDLPVGRVYTNNNRVEWVTGRGTRYRLAAANRRGGRSLSIDRLIMDELREHDDWSAWNAATNACNARPAAQIVAITNQGDDTSVVLDELRDGCLTFIASGEGDERFGLIEWSASVADPTSRDFGEPLPCELDDLDAVLMANPNSGHRLEVADLLGAARRAALAGGAQAAGYRTEVLCQRVRRLNPAMSPESWKRFRSGELDTVRARVAMCLDVAPDGRHVTLYAAAVMPSGRPRIDFVAEWASTAAARAALPAKLAAARPAVWGWFPDGPAAAIGSELKGGVEIRGELASVCMGFADLVEFDGIDHGPEPLIDGQAAGAVRLPYGGGGKWVFSRRGGGYVDAVYAAAGAVHLARTLPPSVGRPRVKVAVPSGT